MDETSDIREAVRLSAARSDDPLAMFLSETQATNGESADLAVPRTDTMEDRESSALFVTAKANSVSDRAAAFNEREQGLRAVGTIAAAFEDRARTASDLERHVGAREVRTLEEARPHRHDGSNRSLSERHQRVKQADEQRVEDLSRTIAQLEQRAAAAATAVTQATSIKTALEREIAELRNQLLPLTTTAQAEAKSPARFKEEAKRDRLPPASLADDRGGVAQDLRQRALKTWRSLPRGSLMAGGVAVSLFVVVAVLVSTVARFSGAEDDKTAAPPAPPVLASRTLDFTPIRAVAPLTPAIRSGGTGRPSNNRSGFPTPPAPVSPVVTSRIAAEKSGGQTVAVREQSLVTGEKPSQFIGTLVVESKPAGATAFINQQSIGKTPVMLKGVRVGSYVVRLEYEGYQRWSTVVTVSTIHEARVTATLLHDGRR